MTRPASSVRFVVTVHGDCPNFRGNDAKMCQSPSACERLRFVRVWLLAIVVLSAGDRVMALSGSVQSAKPQPSEAAAPRELLPFSYGLTLLERDLFSDAVDGRFDRFMLLEAALVASGVDDSIVLRRYRKQFDGWTEQLRRGGTVQGTGRQKARAIFEFLHHDVLNGGYCLECTDLRQAMDRGRFNCVSASVLFNCLAGQFGLETRGLEIPGHAMSRLRGPEGALDIETTCPRWFQWIDHPQRQAEHVQKTLGRSPGSDRRNAREVSAVELIAMIYYNRGVDLLGEKRFSEAAAANAKALRLDPSNATARGNFLATINNWAIELGSSGSYEAAAELLRLGLRIDPRYEAFTLNYVHLYRQWIDGLCMAGRFDEATRLVAQAATQQPGEAYFRHARADIERRQAAARGETAFDVPLTPPCLPIFLADLTPGQK